MQSFRDAASFLTRVPLHRESAAAPNMSAAVPWFAVVGLVLGAIQGGIYVGLAQVASPTLAAALSIAVLALITGAFHHDGLADMADAFGGGWTTEQRLEILKDSRLGTYGVTALILALLIEVSALSSISGWTAFAAAVAAHGLSRSVASFMMVVATPAKNSGLGVDYVRDVSRPIVVASALAMAALVALLFGIAAAGVVCGAYGSGAMVVRLAIAKIGGISGDVLGAVQQVAKLATLIAVVIASDVMTDPGALGGLVLSRM